MPVTDSRSDSQAPRTPAAADAPALGRKPFVRPAVTELGALSELTLIGGTVG
jgi:hypothetical protein